jgi:hypothetical protein
MYSSMNISRIFPDFYIYFTIFTGDPEGTLMTATALYFYGSMQSCQSYVSNCCSNLCTESKNVYFVNIGVLRFLRVFISYNQLLI